jgi:DHA2 family multidrug resistance protein
VTWGNTTAVETLNMMAQRFQGSEAQLLALKQLSQIVHRQALVMAFGDIFIAMTVSYICLSGLVFFVRKVNFM